jgi:hypothetical protein
MIPPGICKCGFAFDSVARPDSQGRGFSEASVDAFIAKGNPAIANTAVHCGANPNCEERNCKGLRCARRRLGGSLRNAPALRIGPGYKCATKPPGSGNPGYKTKDAAEKQPGKTKPSGGRESKPDPRMRKRRFSGAPEGPRFRFPRSSANRCRDVRLACAMPGNNCGAMPERIPGECGGN